MFTKILNFSNNGLEMYFIYKSPKQYAKKLHINVNIWEATVAFDGMHAPASNH